MVLRSKVDPENSNRGTGFAAGIVRAVGIVASVIAVVVSTALTVPFSDHNATDGDRFVGLRPHIGMAWLW